MSRFREIEKMLIFLWAGSVIGLTNQQTVMFFDTPWLKWYVVPLVFAVCYVGISLIHLVYDNTKKRELKRNV